MSVISKLACSQERRDEVPNQELAHFLVKDRDEAGIRELAANLWNRDGNIQADCIKILYEIGYLDPGLISPFAADFLKLLKSRNNRLVWGGMLALSTIGILAADKLYPHTNEIRKVMETGSVITRDAGVQVLAGIASTTEERCTRIFPYLIEHLRTCRPKDVPQHSEKILPAVNAANRDEFISVLEKRMEDLQGTQTKRVEKVIRKA